jgi:predicted CoA-substrate-specific enzyme activase
MIVAGVDGGSRAVKTVLLDADSDLVLASGERDQSVRHEEVARELLAEVLNKKDRTLNDVARIVATGYTRNLLRFAHATVTEITCHAQGVRRQHPDARTIVEVGGQDSKLSRLNEDGSVRDFQMNDRCAAGTGRFLEMVSVRLETSLEQLGIMAAKAATSSAISSMCVVFAESEIIGLLASGVPPDEIAAGVQQSVATRVATLAGRSAIPPVYFTGGVARISGMDKALAEAFGQPVQVARDPHLTGALGAALIAARQARGGDK